MNWLSPSVPANWNTAERTAGDSSSLVTSTRKRTTSSATRSTARKLNCCAALPQDGTEGTGADVPVIGMAGWVSGCTAAMRTLVCVSEPMFDTLKDTVASSQLSRKLSPSPLPIAMLAVVTSTLRFAPAAGTTSTQVLMGARQVSERPTAITPYE